MSEVRTFAFQLKAKGVKTNEAGQELGQIEAYGAVFNNIDDGRDRILPGSFTRTIKNLKARAVARRKRYILKMLWQHDDHEQIGGWYDLAETEYGLLCKGDVLLATQRGREYYELAKAEMSDDLSIIYDVPNGGAKYDKSGVRELSEIRLYSVDPVTFPMNDQTYVISVKARQAKTVVGNTSGAFGPRNESWDASKAETQIWVAAFDADSKEIDEAVAKKYFMVQDGDAQQKGSYSYPFWYVGDDPHICVGAVKAIAASVQGARNASPPDGLKAKVETLYKRINTKYPDDPQLTPPWQDDGKRRTMPNRKDFNTIHQAGQAVDCLEDWSDLVNELTQVMFQVFGMSDTPKVDMQACLDQFNAAVMLWEEKGEESELGQYLNDQGYCNDTPYVPYTLRTGDPYDVVGYMSRRRTPHGKAGRAISAANGDKIQSTVDGLHDLADKAMKAMKAHTQAVHDAADDLATVLQGSESAYGTESGEPEDGSQEGKRVSRETEAHARLALSPADGTASDDELLSAFSSLKTLRVS